MSEIPPDHRGFGPIEPMRMDVDLVPAPPLPYKSPLVTARLLRIFAVASAVAGAVAFAYLRSASAVLTRVRRDPLSVVTDDFVETVRNAERISRYILFALLVTVVLLIVWLRRMYRNLGALGNLDTRFRRGWAVWGWIVPIMNWFRPKQMLDEVWHAGDLELPATYRFSTEREPVPLLVHVWWGFWVGQFLLGFFQGSRFSSDVTLERLQGAIDLSTAAIAIGVIAAVLLERAVAILTVRHHARAVHLGHEQRPLGWALTARVDGRFVPARAGIIAIPTVAAIAGFGLGSWMAGLTQVGDTGLSSPGGEVVMYSEIRPTECFDLPAGGYVLAVSRLPCDEPHDAEALGSMSLGSFGDSYPGLDRLIDEVLDECIDRFEEYVGSDYFESKLDVFFVYPDENAWGAGNREAMCALVALNGAKLDRSMKDSGV